MVNITTIKNISRVKKCSAGTVITGSGSDNVLFVIVKGEVGVFVNYSQTGAEMIRELSTGDLFGDPGLLQDKEAAYTAVSLDESIIIPVERNDITEFFQEEPALAFELLKELFIRLEQPADDAGDAKAANAGQKRRTDAKPPEKKPTGAARPAPAVPAAAPEKAKPAAELSPVTAQNGKFALFPENHGDYELSLAEQNSAILMNKTHTCPVCRQTFTALAVRPSKLVVAATDSDLRYHYKGIEPLYYEVLTCPHCLYSALSDIFDAPEKPKGEIVKALEMLQNNVGIDFGAGKTTVSVFAGFYLALFCAPVAFTKYQLVAAKLQYKLSRVYGDAGDADMENQTAVKALDNYLYAYSRIGVPPAQEQQICVLIGELYLKQNDLKNAITFFNKARTCPGGSPALKNHAENRSYEIREMAADKK
ncbi:Uncharacterized protein, DUF2225 family [Sporobacter termitidis DSM 10068]|uniref:Uncharacterized protein, DUF2225 family n=1 Tax=Sporobacter termitidis DSM 10068 TaxID=1123282 RepID=A0A1M5VBJ3_9FIRM|nr:DUF2225 domain-containing protein [Sporobacter termitidis]SHH72619.1 Uncharacterized protein, DUF2225 family [Sporobacter termitidis DSM 10068]